MCTKGFHLSFAHHGLLIFYESSTTKANSKGQMKSECIYEIIDSPKYHRKNLIDICPESLLRLGMLCTHLSIVALGIIKTDQMYLVYKTFQGRTLSIFFSGTYFGN